jgi:hypothetical protein
MSPLVGTVLEGTKTQDVGQASGMLTTASRSEILSASHCTVFYSWAS